MASTSRQFLMFLITGSIATAVNFFSRILYGFFMNFSLSIFMAYLTGMVVSFFLTKHFVFKLSSRSLYSSCFWFLLVNSMTALLVWSVSLGLSDHLLPLLGINTFRHEIAHAISLGIPVVSNFIGHKHLSFR